MSLSLTKKRSLFIAYSWDVYIKSMYQDIIDDLSSDWNIYHGSEITKKEIKASNVEMFRNRNRQLYDVFVSGIEKSEVFIADVTRANPNVMLELGIAIQLNKNIVIVTSENPNDLPFDIKGFRVNQYNSKQELHKIIEDQLQLFLQIKSQNFKTHFEEGYFCVEKGLLAHASAFTIPLAEKTKNLRLKLDYKFNGISTEMDWLGVHLRAQMPHIISSELLYVRQNGNLESVTFPGRRTPVIAKESNRDSLAKLENGFKRLELIIEENRLLSQSDDRYLEDNLIQIESFGDIVLHAWAHKQETSHLLLVEYRNVEIISLDTISPV